MEVDIKTVLEECKSLSDLARVLFGKENYTNREKCKDILADNGVDWMEWLNIKKQKTKHYCLNCGKELTGDYRKKFCNHSCAASYNNKGVVRNGQEKEECYCLNCGEKLGNHTRKFCNSNCQREYNSKVYIEKWKNGEVNGCDTNGNMSRQIRKYMIEKVGGKCECCGYDKTNPFTNLSILQIHHVDGNCMNNNEENLQVLCPNCHALTENFGRRNTKSGRVNRYK